MQRHDTAVIFDWLIDALSYQGISDSIAYGYMERHGRVRWADIADALKETPSCSKISCYWTFRKLRVSKRRPLVRVPGAPAGMPLAAA